MPKTKNKAKSELYTVNKQLALEKIYTLILP